MIRRGLALILFIFTSQSVHAQSANPYSPGEIKLEMKKLGVLGSVLYIAAHPDDENTALLATMAKGRLYRTAYLSLTRGEGGQNLLGPEQGAMLGLIRTQELLAARKIDGAEQYFSRAIDFGFSKTSNETLRFWGKNNTLADIVWVIRSFRPDVIITRFTPILGGHGNHTASAILAEEAFHAAADPTKFPEQLRFVSPWQAKRIVWNGFRFSQADTTQKPSSAVSIDLGAYSSLLGKSFTEMAGEGRSMHKSQGFGAAQSRGEFLNSFEPIAGDTAKNDLFDNINTNWSRIAGSDSVQVLLEEVIASFNMENPSLSIPLLWKTLNRMKALPQNPWVIFKTEELKKLILSCAGIWIDAATVENAVVPCSEVKFTTTILNRSSYPLTVERIKLPFEAKDTLYRTKLATNVPFRLNCILKVPEKINISQPYWLAEKPEVGSYKIENQSLVGLAENAPPIVITVTLSSSYGEFSVNVPLQQRIIDPVEGELLRPIEIVPPVTLSISDPVCLFMDSEEKQLSITVKSSIAKAKGIVQLKLPEFWNVSPDKFAFDLQNKNDEQVFVFKIRPMKNAQSGFFSAEAEIGMNVYTLKMQTAQYNHIPPQTMFSPAQGKLLRTEIKIKGSTVGYVMGAGDEVPYAIQQLGYSVTLLSDEDIVSGNLDRFDIIVAGVRAYNTRPMLRIHQNRLLNYMQRGGTYIVQYVTPRSGESDNIGPYPLNISRDRVTEEDAPVTILDPKNPIVSSPNKITSKDFTGWIQERGLYFADRWNTQYDSVLTCHDAQESNRSGGLLTAKYGKGYYVYCAYAFFRQLPAGVEGAYRLFANILSLQSDRNPSHKINATQSMRKK